MAGGFAWTGFDYRGEPQPFEWPTVSSSFGIMDLCGFAKDSFYIHQAQWVKDRPVLHLSPHWNWAGQEAKPIRVVVMSNTETVALMLNGKLVGEQKVDPYEMNEWHVPYAPGRLEAVGKTGGKVVAHAVVETTGAPVALRLTPERPGQAGVGLAGDGRDAAPVTVEALDAKGRPVPTANLPVSFEIAGGRIIGLGNGDANSHEPEKGDRRALYNGLAQVIVQTDEGGSGALVLRAASPGLKTAETRIAVRADRGPPSVPRPAA
jgi:beta-galactosidase